MGVDTSRFYKGLKIEYEGNIWEIVEFSSSKMGRMGAIVNKKMKHVVRVDGCVLLIKNLHTCQQKSRYLC